MKVVRGLSFMLLLSAFFYLSHADLKLFTIWTRRRKTGLFFIPTLTELLIIFLLGQMKVPNRIFLWANLSFWELKSITRFTEVHLP